MDETLDKYVVCFARFVSEKDGIEVWKDEHVTCRNYAAAETSEGEDAIADMRADVEDQIAGLYDGRVEFLHAPEVRALSIIDAH